MTKTNDCGVARGYLMDDGALTKFISSNQREVLWNQIAGEEGLAIARMVLSVKWRIDEMPKTYETDGQGTDAKVYLHYFMGAVDAWVTEKDAGSDLHGGKLDDAQSRAFGKICLTGNKEDAEFGYISIEELIANGVELDLYWTVKPLKEV